MCPGYPEELYNYIFKTIVIKETMIALNYKKIADFVNTSFKV